MTGEFGWLAGAVSGMGWDFPGGVARAEVGMGQGSPGALCTEGTLAGQLKLT